PFFAGGEMITTHKNGRLRDAPGKPLSTVSDGDRGPGGKFAPGNRCSRGNPFNKRMAALKSAVLEEIKSQDIKRLVRHLHNMAMQGVVAAAVVLLRYTIGRPPESIDPDQIEINELIRGQAEALMHLLHDPPSS